MKNKFNVVGRGSWLSLAQIELFKKKVLAHFPNLQLGITIQQTAGDKDQSQPLHLVDGKNFFTADVQEALKSGSADFAVHSMKDVSSIDFFRDSVFAIIERDMLHDVAIFNPDVLEKLQRGEPIRIGTSSPRRSKMATAFLANHLPQFGNSAVVTASPVRGNVEVRLKKLDEGLYDGLILAGAGLNRLLEYPPSRDSIEALLADKEKMVLPLFECPPAVGQGAIVVEANPANNDAVAIMNAIRDERLTQAIISECGFGERYGYGCSQQFGAFHLHDVGVPFTYASGQNSLGEEFTEWNYQYPVMGSEKIFSCAEHMKSFFRYNYLDVDLSASHTVLFLSSHRAISQNVKQCVGHRKVWAAGTKTWRELAKENIWVEGCTDSLGLEYIEEIWERPLFNIRKNDVQIVTSKQSADSWQKEGWNAIAAYDLLPSPTEEVLTNVAIADGIFWTSSQQYLLLRTYLKPDVKHYSLPGKTAEKLIGHGLSAELFPSIKAFKKFQQEINKVSKKRE